MARNIDSLVMEVFLYLFFVLFFPSPPTFFLSLSLSPLPLSLPPILLASFSFIYNVYYL